jgi:antitoxin (DNA-binding transcriptional repressor) of toxin-antitoxin stability system
MKTYGIGELKANLPAVLEQVRRGEEIAVSYGRRKENVALIVPFVHRGGGKVRPLGILKGKARCRIRKDFFIGDEELLEA